MENWGKKEKGAQNAQFLPGKQTPGKIIKGPKKVEGNKIILKETQINPQLKLGPSLGG